MHYPIDKNKRSLFWQKEKTRRFDAFFCRNNQKRWALIFLFVQSLDRFLQFYKGIIQMSPF